MPEKAPNTPPEASSEAVDAARVERSKEPVNAGLEAIKDGRQNALAQSATQTEALSQEVLGQAPISTDDLTPPGNTEEPKDTAFLDDVLKYYDSCKESGSGSIMATFNSLVYAFTTGGTKLFDVVKGWFTGDQKKEKSEQKAPTVERLTSQEKNADFAENMKVLFKEFGLTETSDKKKNFFLVAVSLGKEIQEKYGIPYQVVVAQACLESKFGQSGLTQKGLNCFGYKTGSSYSGSQLTMQTPEYHDGILKKEPASFRSYPSLRDSFMDYAKLLKAKRYAKAFEYKNDPRKFLEEIIKAGYAGERKTPELIQAYVGSAEKVISTYGLTL